VLHVEGSKKDPVWAARKTKKLRGAKSARVIWLTNIKVAPTAKSLAILWNAKNTTTLFPRYLGLYSAQTVLRALP